MEPTSPTPRLLDRALRLLERIEAEGGEWTASYAKIARECGLARSTAQLAAADLLRLELVTVAADETPRLGLTWHRTDVTLPTDPTDPTDVGIPTVPTDPTDPTDRTDQPSVDAPPPASASASRPGGSPPLTPSLGESGPPNPAGLTRDAPAPASEQPGTVGTPRPIGSLAVAAAMDAAREAGRSIEPALRARIGNAAQQLAKDESVERILAGARRLGEGGFADLYTAVRAVERGAPPPTPGPAPIAGGSRLQPVLRLFYATWPRAVIDAETWEAELERIPVEYLLAGVRLIARSGEKFPPSWGEIYKTAYRIGVDETERRRSAAERARLRGIVTAIEEGRA